MKSLFKLLFIGALFLMYAPKVNAVVTSFTFTVEQPNCPGDSGRAFRTSVTGTIGPYQFEWNNVGGGATMIGDTVKLVAGTYRVRVRDLGDNSLSFPQFFNVTDPFQVTLIGLQDSVTCNGGGDGQAIAQVFGGTIPYSFHWSTSDRDTTNFSDTIFNLSAGNYTVTVTDNNGCTDSTTITVLEPTAISPNVGVTNTSCNGGSDGSATATPTGGNGVTYTYSWSSTPTNNSPTETGLSANTYTVTVTDKEGCTGTQTFNVGEPTAISITLSPSDAFCFGQANGSIGTTVTGGSTPYTFAWSDNPIPANVEDRNNIISDTYTVTVTDNNGCTATQSTFVGTALEIIVTFNTTNVLCNGDATGAVTASASGGVGAKTFSWSNGLGTGATKTGLLAGTYTVTVEDSFGCTVVDDTTITEPTLLQINIDSQTDPLCNGDANGTINITASGGVTPYTFDWSDVNNNEDRTGLVANTYTVTVTDGNSCTATTSTTLTDPIPIVPNVTPTDAQCNGASDGSATAAPTGGNAPYTYSWSSTPTNNTDTETGLAANTYTVTVTDVGGCSATESFTIGEPTAISITLNPSDAFCFGQANGSITTTVNGGSTPYTFAWSDNPIPANVQDRNNIISDTYTVTVTDNNGCTATQSTFVGTALEIDVTFNTTNVLCNGDATGAVTASASGGVGAKTFSWSNGLGTGATKTGLLAGTYTVTVEDSFGCTVVDDTTITEPPLLQVNIDSQTDPLCNGDANGTINITATGGVTPYTFDWSDVNNNEDRTGLVANTYTVTVTDGNSCTATASTTLTDPAILTATIDSLVDVSCNGLTDGFARVLAAGGTTPYTYNWSNLPTTAANPNLAANTYTVTVTDNNGCTATTTATVNAPNALVASIASSSDASCAGIDDGSATASGTGGTTPYTFNWMPGSLTGATINGLSGGTYFVTVTDLNGCTDSASVNIAQPTAITLTTDSIDVDCNGNSTGSAIVSANGGTSPYTYLWDLNAGSQITDTASGLPAGSYDVTVTDNNGCTNTTTATINEPTLLTATITAFNDPTCNGVNDGDATAAGSGGTGLYTYLWSVSAGSQNTAMATSLSAGTHTVTVTDANGCTATEQVTLTAPPSVVINTDSLANVSCNGGSDGFISIIASGGTPNYTYNWSAPGGTTASLSNLSAGSYTITVTDNNGCFNTRTYVITEPLLLVIDSISVTNEVCAGANDGELTANVSGGTVTTDYTYAWSPSGNTQTISNLSPGTYTVTVTDDNGCTATASETVNPGIPINISITVDSAECNGQASGDLFVSATSGSEIFPNTAFVWSNAPVIGQFNTNVVTGTYTVTVTKANGCTEVDSATVREPDSLLDNATVVPATCSGVNNGSITTAVTGGTGPYTYAWAPGGETTSGISNLAAGNYTITITDNKGCDTNITYTIINGNTIVLNPTIDSTSCNAFCDGSVTLNPTGGTAPYTFSWSDGSTSNPATGLCAGPYSVTVTDNNGCTATGGPFQIEEPNPITATVNTVDENCSGSADGSAGASNTSGGTAPYTYDWSGSGIEVGDTVTGLTGGNYDVTITDFNGCSTVVNFSIGTGATISISETITDALCNGSCDGEIELTPSGGLAPYTYAWAHGDNRSLIDSLCAGTYDVTVTDNNGCSNTGSYVVNEPDTIAPNLILTDESCFPGNDGTADASAAAGGTPPYTYAWSSTGSTLNNIGSLAAGNYTLTITDNNGCEKITDFTIGSAGFFLVSSTVDSVTCFGGSDGQIRLRTILAIPPLTYSWDPDGETTRNISSKEAGTYTVTVTDRFGCTVAHTAEIFEPDSIQANLVLTDESCSPGNDGTADASAASGGVPPYTYNWSTGPTTDNISGLSNGTYTITITDSKSCSMTETFNIGGGSATIIATVNTVDETCSPGTDGSAGASNTSGGAAPYTYDWSGSGVEVGDTVTALIAGNYTVTITDANGCTGTENFTINPGGNLVINATVDSASCFGVCDGQISITPSAGVSPYTFDWNDGDTANPKLNVCAASYTVTITDNTGCSTIRNYDVEQPDTLILNAVSDSTSCNGGCDGSVTLNPTGGTPPYTYSWTTGSTSKDLTGVCAGIYTVTVTDNNGCSIIGSPLRVDEPALLTTIINTEDESCLGANDGSAGASNTSGGTAPYTFDWSGSGIEVGDTVTALAAGSYTVTITDFNGCTITENFTINPGSNIIANEVIDSTSCNGVCDGQISFTPSGGIAPYTYNWSDGPTTNPRGSLCAGTYTITITDNNGCTFSQSYDVEEPDGLLATINTVDETCSPGTDGSAGASNTSGGTAPYTYDWSGSGVEVGDTVTALVAGNYTVTITDFNGCSITENFTINPGGNLIISDSIDSASCNGVCDGQITIFPAGGVSPYSFNWASGSMANPRSGLCAGTYTVTITDNTGCSTIQTYDVQEPDVLTATVNTVDESCSPGTDGSAGASNTSGGTMPYTYDWSGSGVEVGDTVTALVAGNYTVTITDFNGCSITENFTINPGGNILANETIDSTSCNGVCDGEITLAPSGGVTPYTFNWASGSTANPRTGLCAGSYTVTISDNTGCSTVQTYDVHEPDALTATVNTVDESCSPGTDGSAGASNTSGGTMPYTYDWSGSGVEVGDTVTALVAGNYTVTITDFNGCSITENFTINPGGNILANETIDSTSCNGVCDGEITLAPSGGVSPYSFNWASGSRANPRTGLCAGSYTVTITDNTGCSTVQTYDVHEPDALTATVNTVDESCSPGTDGSAGASNTSGGTMPYTYDWSGSGVEVGDTVTALVAGSYTVTITDFNGCSITENFTINSGGNILANETIDSTSCNGVCDGEITLAPSGGVTPYTFNWASGSTANPRTGLCAGSYTVTISDNTGCSTVQTYDVHEPDALTATVNTVDESCSPGTDGSAGASNTSGGTMPYTYDWSGSGVEVGDTVTALVAGSYTVTITDFNGCSITENFTINGGGNILANETIDSTSCNGVCDGEITLAPSGGVTPYTFNWASGSTANPRTGLCAGSYTVTISDNTGCSTVQTYDVHEPDALTATVNTVDESCSPGTDGSAGASNTSGGTMPYTYDWSGSGVEVGDTVTALVAGNYTVTITDFNGCSITENFTINSGGNILANEVIDSTSCNGVCDGEITLAPSGGVTPYTFNWASGSTANPRTGLCAGSYTVTISDNTGCSTVQTYDVHEPDALTATVNTVDESCSPGTDGSAGASNTSGGTMPYTYDWSGSGVEIGDTVLALVAGNYTVTITDFNGCSITENFTINSGGNIQANEVIDSTSCNGVCDGEITLAPSGGVTPYTFNWASGSTANPRTGLCAGSYTVTISDNTGCSTVQTYDVHEPDALTATVNTVDESCSPGTDGSAGASNTSGGTMPYTYDWSGSGVEVGDTVTALVAGNYTVTITDFNGCSITENFTINGGGNILANETIDSTSCNGVCDGEITLAPSGGVTPYTFNWASGSTANPRTGLCAGSYTVTITDNTGCSTVQTYDVHEPDALTATVNTVDESCSPGTDGSAGASNTTGGTMPYTYDWSGSGVEVGDTVTALVAGNYTVTITDFNGCSITENFTIGGGQASIFPNEVFVNESCANLCDGTIDMTPSGGLAPYTFNWDPVPPNGQGVSNGIDLCSGNYNITISDAAGCDTNITITILPSTPITNVITTTDMSCANASPCDGMAIASTSGGVTPYTYNWGLGDISGTGADTNKAICTGPYSVTITDANGCSIVDSYSIGSPAAITSNFITTNATCNICDGKLEVNISGGIGDLTYQWFDSGLNPIGTDTNVIENRCSGAYSVQVIDNTGCSETFFSNISDNGSEVLAVSKVDVSCFGGNDGEATVSYNCSDPNCSTEWFDASTGASLGITTNTATGLTAGDYYVEVINNSGCIAIENIRIDEAAEINIVANVTEADCNGNCNGAITVNVTGGTGVYTYNWTPAPPNGQLTNSVSGLCAGIYTLNLYDENGCLKSMQYEILQPSQITNLFTIFDASCGLADGSINSSVSGGTVAVDYQYQWFDGSNSIIVGETSSSITNVAAGTYHLRVIDDNSCVERFSAVVGNSTGPLVQVDSIRDNNCNGINNGAIFITASDANTPLTYNWLPGGQTTDDIANLNAGIYTVQVTNALGCVTVETVSINEPNELVASIDVNDASCGLCNGSSNVSVSGGTTPYTYLWSNGSTADSASNLCGGTHSLEVIDANGCNKTFNFSISTDGGPSSEIINASPTSCASACDGSVTVNPIGGSLPYTYLWQHNGATTNSLSNLCKGSYTLIVSDSKGCSRTVSVEIDSPNELIINEQLVANECGVALCSGSILLDVSGGQAPYSFNWSSVAIDTNFVDQLCEGIYNVTVTDNNGCSAIESYTIGNQGNPIVALPTVTNVNCNGECTGSLMSNLTPSSTVSFQWLDNAGQAVSSVDTDVIGIACAGDYVLEVTALPENCKSYFNVTIQEKDSIILGGAPVKPIGCSGNCDGEIFVSVTGGDILYTYSWSDPNNQTTNPAIGLCAGNYIVTVTDESGCSETTRISITEPNQLTASINSNTDLGCSSECNATATASASGGILPYTFEWDGGQTGMNPIDLCFGQNILTVTDSAGCTATDTVMIAATDTVVGEIFGSNIICFGDSIDLGASITGPNITSFGWYESDTTTLLTTNLDTAIFRSLGNYTFFFIVTDGSCADTIEYNPTVVPNPVVTLSDRIMIFKDDVARLEVGGGDVSYLYNWSPARDLTDSTLAEPIASPKETVTYVLTVTDTNGCMYTDSTIVEYSPIIRVPSGLSPNGDGVNDIWELPFLDEFPNATVQVFNRWGELLYEQKNGYNIPWDGKFEGKVVPIGTYYYIIDFNEDRIETMTGPITIVK